MRLTDMTLQKLPAPARGQKLYTDDIVPGFAVRVSQGGTRTFLAIVGKERRSDPWPPRQSRRSCPTADLRCTVSAQLARVGSSHWGMTLLDPS